MKSLTMAALATIVTLASAPAHAEPLAAIVMARATAALPADLAVTEVHLARSLAALDVAPDQVEVVWLAAPRVGRTSVKVRLRAGRVRTVFVPVTLAAVVDVAVATRDLAIGERLTAADIRIERRAGSAGAAAPAVIGQEVTAAMRAGDVVEPTRLTTPPPVARGTEVTVRVRRGRVEVVARGRLEAAARPGGPARVRLAATRMLVDGMLTSPSVVVVGDGS